MNPKTAHQKEMLALSRALKNVWSGWCERELMLFQLAISTNKQLTVAIPNTADEKFIFVAAHNSYFQISVLQLAYCTRDENDDFDNWYPVEFADHAIAINSVMSSDYLVRKTVDIPVSDRGFTFKPIFDKYLTELLYKQFNHYGVLEGSSLWYSYNKRHLRNLSQSKILALFEKYLNSCSISNYLEIER